MNPKGTHPPLSAWPFTLLFLFIVFASSIYYYRSSSVRQDLKALDAVPVAKGPRIIMLGTSLLRSATFSDKAMVDFGSHHGFNDFSNVRLTKSTGVLEDFVPLLDTILSIKPDVIILESHLFYVNPDKEEPTRTWYALKRFLRGFIFHPVKTIRRMEGIGGGNREAINLNIRQDSAYLSEELSRAKKFSVRPSLPDEFHEFLRTAQRNNIRIFIADIPRYEPLEIAVDASQPEGRRMSDVFNELHLNYGAGILRFPEKLDLGNYVDFSHMNLKGREKYSLWLLTCLMKP